MIPTGRREFKGQHTIARKSSGIAPSDAWQIGRSPSYNIVTDEHAPSAPRESDIMSDSSATPHGAFSDEPRKAKGDPAPAADAPTVTIAKPERPATPSSWRNLVGTLVVAAITAGVVACVISIGANLLLGRVSAPGGRLTQEGKVSLGAHGEREVFYAVPFAGPPNLELETPLGGVFAMENVKLKEQKADHFTIQNTGGGRHELRWRAEGIRAEK
jgi:hypothetical protein